MNGVRCIACHLNIYQNFEEKKIFLIKMGNQIIDCEIEKNEKNKNIKIITTKINKPKYLGNTNLEINLKEKNKKFFGHYLNIGNPHFIILQKIDLKWLEKNGKLLESHNYFEKKSNIEFVWKNDENDNQFQVLVYERGCGYKFNHY
jgi:diaminopimelate epimerase